MLVVPLGSPVLEEVAADHSSILELPSSMSMVSSLIFCVQLLFISMCGLNLEVDDGSRSAKELCELCMLVSSNMNRKGWSLLQGLLLA
jgi:hypothetical protein